MLFFLRYPVSPRAARGGGRTVGPVPARARKSPANQALAGCWVGEMPPAPRRLWRPAASRAAKFSAGMADGIALKAVRIVVKPDRIVVIADGSVILPDGSAVKRDAISSFRSDPAAFQARLAVMD